MRQILDANTVFGFWPKRKLDASAATLVSRLTATGVDRALTCSIRGWLYDFKEGNDETMKTCADSGGRLLPVATINPSTFFGTIEEVDRVVSMGFRVVRFFPTEQEWTVTQRHFGRLLAKLAGSKLVLMVPSSQGFSAIASVFEGVPNNVIIESKRAYPHTAEMIVVMQETPNLYVETHSIGGMDYICTLTHEIGDDRLLFGSGAPQRCISSALLPILKADISDESKARILSGNLCRLMGITA